MTPSWRSRLHRADEHLQEIEREIQTFLAREPYRVVGEVQQSLLRKNQLFYFAKGRAVLDPPPRLGDVIGDFLSSLRSALDQLAYRLAGAAGKEPPHSTEFPIFWNPHDFRAVNQKGRIARGSGLYKMRTMPDAAQTVIEGLQPYAGLDPADFPPANSAEPIPDAVLRHRIFVLHELRRLDFHREPHVTGAVCSGSSVGIKTLLDVDLFIPSWGTGPNVKVGAFDDDTVIGSMAFTITGPNPVVNMQPNFTFDVALDPEGPGRGEPVIACLRSLRDHVEGTVFPQLEGFV